MTTVHQRFRAVYEFPVVFTRKAFAVRNPALASAMDRLREPQRHDVIVFVDEGVLKRRPRLSREIERYFRARAGRFRLLGRPRRVAGGERVKNDRRAFERVVNELFRARLCRHSFVVIVGGGAALDAVGLAASLVHRGLRTVRVPTTALAQCDSGVGVKTAVNWKGAKNLLGTFAPPFAVVNDFDLLATLTPAGWKDGIAEAFKVAIIKDAAFFRYLCRHAAALRARSPRILERVIRRCADLHLAHIRTSGDPFEQGRARPLDFGHWAAHKLEAMSRYRISHGQAVAAGVALDAIYAEHEGWLSAPELEQVLGGLRASGLRLWYPELARRARGRWDLLGGLRDFREHLGGELCVTFPDGIGRKRETGEVDTALMRRAMRRLKGYAGG